MRISMFDLEPLIFDLEGKNSKFRRMRSLRMVPKNISMRFQHSPIKTVGQVKKQAYLGIRDLRPREALIVYRPAFAFRGPR